jgi:hypothetical protein
VLLQLRCGRQHLLGHRNITVISTTQTPPTVAIGGLVITSTDTAATQ